MCTAGIFPVPMQVTHTCIYKPSLFPLKSHFCCIFWMSNISSQNLQLKHSNLEHNLHFMRQDRNPHFLESPEILKPVVLLLTPIRKCSFDEKLPLYRKDGIFHKKIYGFDGFGFVIRICSLRT